MDNRTRKKVGIGVIAGLASVSVILGGIFDSSKDLLQDYPKTPKAVIESIDDYSRDDLEENEDKDDVKKELKKLIYRIPVRVRAVLFLPLWLLGSALLYGFDLLLKLIFLPAAKIILGFVLQTLILFAIVALCIKLLFPDLPWSKIFSKKLFLSVLVGSVFISLCDFIVPMFWEDYHIYRALSKAILLLIVIFLILRPFIRKKLKEPVRYEIVYNGKVLG